MRTYAYLSALLLMCGVQVSQAQDVTVSAASIPDEGMSQSYMKLDDACKSHVFKHDDPTAGVAACKLVSDEADHFDPASHYITRRAAYVYYATSLIQAQRPQEAVAIGDKAVAVVRLGHDDESGSSAAYNIRGQAEGLSRNFDASDKDLDKAENLQRAALARTELHKAEYSKVLKNLLLFHAALFKAMNKNEAAQVKLEEAAKL